MNKQHEESFEKYLDKGGLPCIDIKIKGKNFIFLIDSGSDLSYIDSNVAEDLDLKILSGLFTSVTSLGASSDPAPSYEADIELTDSTIKLELTGVEIRKTTVQLIQPFDGILGVDFLKMIGGIISFKDKKLIY